MNRISAKAGAGKQFFFILIGIFLLLAPLSVSNNRNFDNDDSLKWIRAICLVVIGLYGLRWFRIGSDSPATKKLLIFAFCFTVSAVWSTSPFWGLAYKGLFLAAIVGGITLGSCLKTEGDFRVFARTATTAATVAVAGMIFFLLTQDEDIFLRGRLRLAQINPNVLAQSATIFALLCMFHLLISDRRRWMTQAILCLLAMLVATVLTGSRGATLMLISGVVFLLPAFGRKRRQVLFLTLCSGLVLLFVVTIWLGAEDNREFISSGSRTQLNVRLLDELNKNTRADIWNYAIAKSMESPVIGHGWLSSRNRGTYVQSAYLQVLAETGLVGIALLVIFLAEASQLIYRSLRLGRRKTSQHRILMLVFSATAAAMLLHGAFESSLVTGASPNAIILAFCISQLDHLYVANTYQHSVAHGSTNALQYQSLAAS